MQSVTSHAGCVFAIHASHVGHEPGLKEVGDGEGADASIPNLQEQRVRLLDQGRMLSRVRLSLGEVDIPHDRFFVVEMGLGFMDEGFQQRLGPMPILLVLQGEVDLPHEGDEPLMLLIKDRDAYGMLLVGPDEKGRLRFGLGL
nr:hypothetical protein [Geothrix limicola]